MGKAAFMFVPFVSHIDLACGAGPHASVGSLSDTPPPFHFAVCQRRVCGLDPCPELSAWHPSLEGETVVFSDYRPVDGERIPFRGTISDALGETTVEVEQARFGAPIEDSAFAPGK